jgi:hypothetical protein
MFDVVIYMGAWIKSVMIPRPIAGDYIRVMGHDLLVEKVVLSAGSPAVEALAAESGLYDPYAMRMDGWENI